MDRRTLVLALMAAGCTTQTPVEPPKPVLGDLRDGDFLWPRDPKAWIPYLQNERSTAEIAAQAADFESGKAAFLAEIRANPRWFREQDIRRLAQVNYEAFRRSYDLPDRAQLNGPRGGNFSVGHVAIVAKTPDGSISIVEAVWGSIKKVRRVDAASWLSGHASDWVFHGRLRGHTPAECTAMRTEAEKHIGRPYDFWNFDLNDDSGFYCSKLAWLATHRALNLAIDGHSNPHRVLWFSPKQMFKSPTIEHLNGECCYLS